MSLHNGSPESTKPVTIHTGLFLTELEPALVRDLNSCKNSDPLQPVIILVGSELLKEYLEWQLAHSEVNCLNLRIVTFAGLSRDLNRSVHTADDRPPLPVQGEYAVCANVINSLDRNHYFGEVIDRPGFRRALARSFYDLDQAGISQLEIRNQVGKFDALKMMREKYVSRISYFRRNTDYLISPDNSHREFQHAYKTDTLFIYGIYDFTALQRNLLRSLAARIKLNIYIPYIRSESGLDGAFGYVDKSLTFFQNLSTTELDREKSHTKKDQHGFGGHLFRYSTSDETVGKGEADHLTVFKAVDISSEVNELVSRINEMALWEKVPLHRIGVLMWNPDRYLPSLRKALDSANLPYSDSIGMTLAETAAGQALNGLLNLRGPKIKRRCLVDFLVSNELRLSEDDTNPAPDVSEWEVISIESGIVEEGRKGWLNALRRIVKETESNTPPDNQTALFINFLNSLFDSYAAIPDEGEWGEFVQPVVNLISIFLPQTDIRARIINVVRQFSVLNNLTGTLTFEQFRETLSAALGQELLNRSGFGENGIILCDKMISRGTGFDVLFIPGLTQGSVPVAVREDPILTDEDRNSINKAYTDNQEELLPLKAVRQSEEQLLFALAVDSARERLVLSFPEKDDGRNVKLPSRFLLEICRVVIGRPVSTEDLTSLPFFEDTTDMNSPNPLFRQRLTDPNSFFLEWVRHNVELLQCKSALYSLYYGRSERFDRVIQAFRARNRGDLFTEWDGVIPSADTDLEPQHAEYSVARLEKYATCPFQYLVHYVLKAKPTEEPEILLQLPPQDVGSFIHRVLQKFFTDAKANNRLPLSSNDKSLTVKKILSIMEGESYWLRSRCQIPDSIWQVEWQALERRLRRFIADECDIDDLYSVVEMEKKIDTVLPFKIKDEIINIKVKGKADRIDISPDEKSIRIIDYKTGKPVSKPENLKGGVQLQLPIYLLAALVKYTTADLTLSHAQYLNIDQAGERKAITLEGDTLEDRKDDLGTIVGTIRNSIRSGLFPPNPEKNTCNRCDIKSVCDWRSRNSFHRRKTDPRIKEILKMWEIV